jgi:uncharacterized protein YcbX
MSRLGQVASIFRYPVKTLQGESVDSIAVTDLGFEGDRLWALRDEKRGDFGGGKRIVPLMNLSAQTGKGGAAPTIELPSGKHFAADDPGASQWLSEALDHPVTIWPVGATPGAPAEVEEVADLEADFRAAMGREGDEPSPDFSQIPPNMMEYLGKAGRPYVDLAPLLVMTQQSLDTLARAATSSKIDVRRFRPSFVIDADAGSEFPEQDWIGARIRVGSAIFGLPMTCPRCVMTTREFADLPRDPGIMRKLVTEAGGNLGVYGTILQPGTISVGDTVERMD